MLNYFYSLTPRQFHNLLVGYRNKEESTDKSNWIRARFIAYHAIVAMQGSEEITQEDIILFPWEEQKTVKPIEFRKPKSKEELAEIWRNIDT